MTRIRNFSRPAGVVATGLALVTLSGCSALVSTTNTTADALHTVSHGVSVSSRSTTNVTSGGDADQANAARTREFVASEHAALRREAAFGGGEHIRTLAELVGDDQPTDLGAWMQSHYGQLFGPGMNDNRFIAAVEGRTG